ncbi:hypothetical protein J4450_02295 [Candidatus Micrarchaeota archaeon]|nr:hypothetical protein [Candidatus Micrarchaeota archaeon]
MGDRAGVQKGPKQLAFSFAEKGQEAGGPLGRVLGQGVDVLHESVAAVHDAVREEGAAVARLMTSFTGEMGGLARNLGAAKDALDALKSEVSSGNSALSEQLGGLATRISEVQAGLERAVTSSFEAAARANAESISASEGRINAAVGDSKTAVVEGEARLKANVDQAQAAVMGAVERKAGETNAEIARALAAVQAVQADVKAVLSEFTDADNGKVNLLIGALVSTSDKVDAGLERLDSINRSLEAQAVTLAVHTEALGRIERTVVNVETVSGRVLSESRAVLDEVVTLGRQVELSVRQGGEDVAAVKAHVDAQVAGLKDHVDGAVTLMLSQMRELKAALGDGLAGVIAAVHAAKLKPTEVVVSEQAAPVLPRPIVGEKGGEEPKIGEAVVVKAAGPGPSADEIAHMEPAPSIHEATIREAEESRDLARLHSYALVLISGQNRDDAKLAIDALERLKATDVLFSVRQRSTDVELADQASAAFGRVASLKDQLTLIGDQALIDMFLQSDTAPERKGEILNLFLEERLRTPILDIYRRVERDDKQSVRAALDKFDRDLIAEAKQKIASGDLSGHTVLVHYGSMLVEEQTQDSARLAMAALEEQKEADALGIVANNLEQQGYPELELLAREAIERLTPERTVVTRAVVTEAARTEVPASTYDADALLVRLKDKSDPSELQRAIDVAGEYLAVESIPDLLDWVVYAAVFRPSDERGKALQGNEAMISGKAISALEKIGYAKNENAEAICRQVLEKLRSTHAAGFLDKNAFQLINAKPLVRLTINFSKLLSKDLTAQVRAELEFLRGKLREEDAAGSQTRVILRDAVTVYSDIEEALAALPKNGRKKK